PRAATDDPTFEHVRMEANEVSPFAFLAPFRIAGRAGRAMAGRRLHQKKSAAGVFVSDRDRERSNGLLTVLTGLRRRVASALLIFIFRNRHGVLRTVAATARRR